MRVVINESEKQKLYKGGYSLEQVISDTRLPILQKVNQALERHPLCPQIGSTVLIRQHIEGSSLPETMLHGEWFFYMAGIDMEKKQFLVCRYFKNKETPVVFPLKELNHIVRVLLRKAKS